MKACLPVIFALALLLFSCSQKQDYFKMAQNAQSDDAKLKLLLMAVAAEDNAPMAHYQSALLLDKRQDCLPRQAWHLNEYLRLSPKLSATEKADTEKWLAKIEKKYTIQVNQKLDVDIRGESDLRIQMMEEFAIRQKQWIQELTLENQNLRQQLAELQHK